VDSVSGFRAKLGANDLNCVDVPLNPTHSRLDVVYNSGKSASGPENIFLGINVIV